MTDANPLPPALSLRDYMPYRLAVTSNQVSRLVARAYQDRFGLSIWEWRVIALLGEAEPMTAQALSDIAAMDKVSVSRAVKALVERGLVHRAEREADRRSRDLRLTGAGRQTYREITPVALGAEADLLTGLDDSEIAVLAGVLDKVRHRAAELLAGPAPDPSAPDPSATG
ncbi:MarR family transcriptional regulator [Maricaulis sp.]|uniref:MarR family winged helix-turn-helix transcriptional regulator n=1 Tax=Maricaulis sp. TaxID=1486257 RepID=UPI0025BF4FC7|nr:MarR family transcriptional regulator [Maricaulis sp.]